MRHNEAAQTEAGRSLENRSLEDALMAINVVCVRAQRALE